jgi:hypothetical protein
MDISAHKRQKSLKASFSAKEKENDSFSPAASFVINYSNISPFFFAIRSLLTDVYSDLLFFTTTTEKQ